ncbi:MAG: pitrilysin family protein [Verrucomicrobiota bacterium]|jgi:predicted Zn-dependent peptidase|nr:pitrilysin family protein [Verrucomicrobiota bacterium]|tara:strand:- start:1334 stop:2827 length:1494 start_codon:yes stop_codon:yes gene_type:complete
MNLSMKQNMALGLVAILGLALGQAQEIPDRPEKLTFPPLVYDAPNPADYREELESGAIVYIYPDRERPLIDLSVNIRAGSFLDTEGKEGLANLTGHLMARGGIPSKPANELDEELEFLAARLSSSFGGLNGSISLNLLSKDADRGFEILRAVLAAPSFQEDKLALRKTQLLQGLKQRNDDSRNIESRERNFLAYGENFWFNRHTTAASLESIRREDLLAFHHEWVHPRNFIVSISGDFDRDAMLERLDGVFAAWPHPGKKAPPVPQEREYGKSGVYIVDKDVNQGRVSIMLPGIRWDDPDFYAIQVMNDVLGGGGFTSRITNRVRSDEGLAYSAGSSFPGGSHYPVVFRAGFQSKSRTVAYATSIVLEEIERIAGEPVSAEELLTAKKSFIDTFPNNFASSAQVVSAFAGDEMIGRYARQPNYWAEYRDNIEAVDIAAVQRVAKRRLRLGQVIILIVGQKEEILKGHPDHPVELGRLAKGGVKELPMRDPLTMKPLK